MLVRIIQHNFSAIKRKKKERKIKRREKKRKKKKASDEINNLKINIKRYKFITEIN